MPPEETKEPFFPTPTGKPIPAEELVKQPISDPITGDALEGTQAPVVNVPDIPDVPLSPPPEKEAPIDTTQDTSTDDLFGELESAVEGVTEFDRGAQVTQRTQAQERRLIEINKQIALRQTRDIKEQEAARISGRTTTFGAIASQKVRRTQAIEGLELSAERAAIIGELSLARELAGDAVDAKFAEAEANLNTQRANLIANFENFSKADQKRAEALLLQIDGDLKAIEDQKENQKAIEEQVNTAASFGGTPEQLADIRNSATEAEATRKRTEAGLVDPLDKLKVEKAKLDIIKLRKDISEGDGAVTFTDSNGVTITLTKQQADDALEIGGKVTADPVYKDMTDIQRGLLGVFSGLSQGDGFGDVTAINAFQRMIDPGATVRAEDVVLLQSASAILAKISPKFISGKVTKGDKLPEQVRNQMRKVAKDLYDASILSYQSLSGNRFNSIAAVNGLTPGMIGTNFATSDELIAEKSLTPEQKTQALDKIIQGTDVDITGESTTPSTIDDNPVGFFEGFLNIFGLSRK